MEYINFDPNKVQPVFDNGINKWYDSIYFNEYIKANQADNLPSLDIERYRCFIVIGPECRDYVFVDDKQRIWGSYRFNAEGHEQMKVKINIIKISKHYDDSETVLSRKTRSYVRY